MQHSDIIEIRIYDSSHQIFFKGQAKIKKKKDMIALKNEMENKGVHLFGKGWFD